MTLAGLGCRDSMSSNESEFSDDDGADLISTSTAERIPTVLDSR